MDGEIIKVLIADDQRMFAESIKYIIESRASDILIVGIAYDGREALRQVGEHRPHVLLLDVRMPIMDGVQTVRLLHRQHPEVKVLMLTTFPDDEYVQASLKHGAAGYLLKNRPPLELITAIRAVMGGVMLIDPAVSQSLIRGKQNDMPNEQILVNLKSLTHREREILTLMIQALDNRQIANTLKVAEQTVRNYVSMIYDKLGVTHRMGVLQIVDTISSFLESEGKKSQ